MRSIARVHFASFHLPFRCILREPSFSALVITLLALGIATTSLLLTAIDRLLLHPINAPHSESLVRAATFEPKGLVSTRFPYAVYSELNQQVLTLSSTAADADVDVGVSLGGLPEPAVAHMVSASYFTALAAPALLGRTLVSADDRGDGTAVVLSFGLWQRHFGGSPSVLGRKLFIDAQSFVIVGVMPRGFFGASLDSPADLWIPVASQVRISSVPLDSPHPDRSFEIIARLKEGVPLLKAKAEFATTFANIIAAHPELSRREPQGELGTLETIVRRVTWNQDQISKVLLLLLGALGLTFAILCANVAGLFLVRAARHERETAVRISLGATPAQLLIERVSESLVLGLLGMVSGLALAWVGSPILLRFVPVGAGPLPVSLRPGLNVAAVSAVIAVVLSILFGGAAVWHGTRQNFFAALRSGTATSRLGRLGKSLVVTQVGLAVMLVFGAALLVRTLSRLAATDPGFNRDHLTILTLDLAMAGVEAPLPDLPDRLVRRVQLLPQVRSAALAALALMHGRGFRASAAVLGSRIKPDDFMNTSLNAVSPNYFETLGIPLLAGRGFSPTDDRLQNPTPVVISHAFARFLFPHQEALGHLFGIGAVGETAKAEYEIVGIVGDAKYRSLREVPPPTFYIPLKQRPDWDLSFVLYVRTAGEPHSVIPALRTALYDLDPQLPFAKVDTMPEELTHSVWQERLLAFLTGVFAGLSVLLSATALYGVLAFEIRRRRREIAVRLALGAQVVDVVTLAAKVVGTTLILGCVAGLLACFGLGRFLQSYVYGITTLDAFSIIGAIVLVCTAVALACLGPMRHVIYLPPALVLRDE